MSLSIALVILLLVGALATLYFTFPDTYDAIFTAKLNSTNESGQIHQTALAATSDAVKTFTFMNQLFGIGFGYFYGSVFSAVLVNTGWIGITVFIYAFLKPVILLRPDNGGLALKVGILTLFFLYYVNVSELFCPQPGCFSGWRTGGLISKGKRERQRKLEQSARLRWPGSLHRSQIFQEFVSDTG